MKLLTLLLFFISFHIFANEVKIETNPTRPIAGEVFQAYFRIFTDSDESPVINFSPSNLEVVSKTNQGVSTRTIYANGKLTVTREVIIAYELVASRAGFAALRDINIQIGSKAIRHPTVNLNVLKEPEVLADVFIMADVPKKELFLGEGLLVRYFIYSKVPINNLDVKKYPKLDNFLKRFIQEADRSERVSVDGQIYMRTQIYAAKLFPEKIGELKVDSLQVSASYPSSRSQDPFAAFGQSRDYKTRTINSETIKITVKPLPTPVPTHFTGLVGEHDFQIQFGQNKVIVNEPLEIKLTVSGSGALENFEAPSFIQSSGLEEFESNGDLKISSADQATKIFDYTFLAKENLNLPAKTFVLSYFDPKTEQYVPSTLNIPEIIVAGGAASSSSSGKVTEDEKPKTDSRPIDLPKSLNTLAGPITVDEWAWRKWVNLINLSLAVLVVAVFSGWVVWKNELFKFSFNPDIPSTFKKDEFKLDEFIRWISPLITQSGKSPQSIIKSAKLSDASKDYFIGLLDANDYKNYSSEKTRMDYKYRPQHFKELGRYIKSVDNENFGQPT